jgi:hypothetical protein
MSNNDQKEMLKEYQSIISNQKEILNDIMFLVKNNKNKIIFHKQLLKEIIPKYYNIIKSKNNKI